MAETPQIDYDALAEQARTEKPARTSGTATPASSTPTKKSTKPVDYDALAEQARKAKPATPSTQTNDTSDFMAVTNPKGLIKPGNLSIWNRPIVQNADGSHSSEYSTSFADGKGHEVLVPTVVNGKFLTPDGKKPPEGSAAEKAMFKTAWQHYLKTGENLGVFDNPANADAYAQQLHNRGSKPVPAGPAPTLSPSALSAVTHPFITPGEGQYQMRSKNGTPTSVSYSHVKSAIHQGYTFTDRSGPHSLAQFARDHASDPAAPENHTEAALRAMSNWNPVKYLGAIGLGVSDAFQGAGGETAKVLTAFDKPATSEFETNLQLAAETPPKNFTQGLSATGEQIGELFTVPETKLAEGVKAGRLAKTALTAVEQGTRAAGEQGLQTFVHTGGDTAQTKHAIEAGGIAGAASAPTAEIVKAAGRFAGDVGRHFAQVGEIQTSALVRKTEKVNEVISARAARIREANEAKIAQYEKDVAEANQKATATNATAAEKAAAENTRQEAEAAAARLKHDNAILEQEQLAAKRANLTRSATQLQNRLALRVQSIHNAAQQFFKKNYNEVEEAIDGPADQPSGRVKSWDQLASAVEDSLPKIEGSKESIKPFKDILDKAQRFSPDEDLPPTADQDVLDHHGYTKTMWSAKTPDERAEIWDSIKEAWGPEAEGANFKTLKGYYSEAGALLASPSTPGDVKQALVKFRDAIDDMQQDLANEAGVGQRYKLLRSQYKNYAEGFLDYQGPNKSGSPVALALKGEDIYHQTEPMASKNLKPAEISRIKQILAGKPTDAATQFVQGNIETLGGRAEPAWRYRRDTTKLLDNYRAIQHELDSLPKSKTVEPLEEKVVEPTAVKQVEPSLPKPPTLKRIPEQKTLSPTQLRAAKAEALHKRAQILNHFGTYVATSGVVGGLFALSMAGRTDPETAIKHAAEGLVVGAISPYILAKVLEKPGVVEALSRPTQKDMQALMRLPKEQRPQVEESLRWMAEEAQRTGKLKQPSPWLRILAGTAAKNQGAGGDTGAATTTPTSATPQVMPLPTDQSQPTVMPVGAQ